MTGILRAKDFYHTGIVVPDIPGAQARMTAVAGYRWTEIFTGELPIRMAEGERVLRMRYTYSVEAPHIELVQEIPGTPWTAAPNVATHHLGYFCDDLVEASRRLTEAGFEREACAVADGEPTIFAYHRDAAGVRVEIVDRALVPDFEAYVRANVAS